MVGQAAEGLGADDVAVAALDQLDHLGGQKPTLAHLGAQRNHPFGLFDQLFKGPRGVEARVGGGFQHGPLDAVQVVQQLVGHQLGGQLAAVEGVVLAHVEDAVLAEAHQTGEVDLAVLALQKLLQIVVAQGAVFDVDFAHDAHLDLGHPGHRNGGEGLGDQGEGVLHLPGGVALVGQDHPAQTLHPAVHHPVGRAGLVLVRGDLVAQGRQHIPVEDEGHRPAGQGQGHLETAVLFQAREVQAGYRDLGIARLDQGLAQQVDVVGSPAAAARLGDQQGGVVQVVFAAVQGVQKLADDQQRRVTGVVVDVFQPQLGHGAAAVAQDLALIAVELQRVLQKPELGHRHVGDQNGVGALHLRGKFGILVFHGLPPMYLRRWLPGPPAPA